MWAEIGLDLDDSARHDSACAPVHQQLSQQPGADKLGRALKEAARQQPAWQSRRAGALSLYLCAFCHSFSSLSTSSA